MSEVETSGHSVVVPELGIYFSSEQLDYLNKYFTNLEQTCNHALNSYYERMIPSGGGPNLLGMDVPGSIEAIMERLVQRIITGVGTLDPRFASKYVLSTGSTYEHYKINEFDEFDFMVRLDQLSSPALNVCAGNATCDVIDNPESVPKGYARVYVKREGNQDHQWSDFMDENGFLLPHKIRHRFYELVRWAVKAIPVSMSVDEVDETKLPGASGKVLDVGILSDVLHLDPDDHVYIGIGDPDQDIFPEPKDFSIKVSQDGPAVRLDMVVPATHGVEEQRVSVDLTISIGVNKWPQACDFPDRISHCHVDAIHSYRAGTKGFHVVCTGPHESLDCSHPETLWRISHSSAEMDMMTHFDHCSIPAKVMRITKILIGCMRDADSFKNLGDLFQPLIENSKHVSLDNTQLETLSTYVLKTLFLFELENYTDVEDWLESRVSCRVLSIILALLSALKRKEQRSYFYPEYNVLLRKGVDISASENVSETLLDLLKFLNDFSLARPDNVVLSPSLIASISFENDVAALWKKQIVDAKKEECIDVSSMKFTERQILYLNALYQQVAAFTKFRGPSEELHKFYMGQKDGDAKMDKAGYETMLIILDSLITQMKLNKSKLQEASQKYLYQVASTKLWNAFRGTHTSQDEKLAEKVIATVTTLIANLDDEPECAEALEDFLIRIYHCSWVNGWFMEDVSQCLEPPDLTRVKQYARRVLDGSDAQEEFEKAVMRKEEWAM